VFKVINTCLNGIYSVTVHLKHTTLKRICVMLFVLVFGFYLAFYLTSTYITVRSTTDVSLPVTFHPCIKLPTKLDEKIGIQCGLFRGHVYINEKAHVFSIRFAVVTPTRYQVLNGYPLHFNSNNIQSDGMLPLLYIEGGPGVGNVVTSESLSYWQRVYFEQKLNRPLVIYSPVGTKGSSPYPICQAYYDVLFNLFDSDSHSAINKFTQHISHVLHQCVEQENTIDIYSSYQQKTMLLNLMAALGFDQWHVWGSSYGTRLALLLGHDKAVKRLLLDAPYLFHQGGYSQDVRLYYHALHLLEKKWQAIYPDQSKQAFSVVFDSALKTLSEHKIFVSVRNRRHKPTYILKDINYLLTPKRLFELGFFSLYSSKNTQNFFNLLLTLRHDKFLSEQYYSIQNTLIDDYIDSYTDQSFNPLMYYFVECQDNGLSTFQEVNEAIYQSKHAFTKSRLNNTTKHWLSILKPFDDAILDDYRTYPCRHPRFHQRYTVNNETYPDKPMLFLAGEYDPVTPSDDLTLLPKKDNIFTLIKKGAGHGVLTSQYCQAGVVDAFLAKETLPRHSMKKINRLCD